jgi:mono/diheme cytochrome c family protein
MAKAGAKPHADLAVLREGRRLFVSRCIECHTLPPYWHYRARDWPEIVDSMAHRASLKKAERDAVVAYLLAAREL